MQQRVNLKITFDVTTPEGQSWHKTTVEYADLPVPMLMDIEDAALDTLKRLNVLGREQDAGKAPPPLSGPGRQGI
jgi:hypothetical protein